MALKQTDAGVQFSGVKVTPDEIDQDMQYIVLNPSDSTTYNGTVETAVAAAIVLTNTKLDYPRNLKFSALGVAGGLGGTLVMNGKDQFGNVIQETLGFATAAGGGTANGTKVFAEVTSGTYTPVGLGGTAVGSAKLGPAIGTSTTGPLFGIPAKLGAVTDIKNVTWINNGTATKAGGTAQVDLVNNAFRFAEAANVSKTDAYVITYRSSKKVMGPNVFKR